MDNGKDNFEILDDWPLHPTDRVHFTKLVVGACWKGLDEQYVDHFQGYLAGLTLLKDKTESERVIQCLNNCQENLDFTELEDMPSGTVSILIFLFISIKIILIITGIMEQVIIKGGVATDGKLFISLIATPPLMVDDAVA